jgi:hypothetical protein
MATFGQFKKTLFAKYKDAGKIWRIFMPFNYIQGWCSKVAQSSFFSEIKTQLISSCGGQKTTKYLDVIFF